MLAILCQNGPENENQYNQQGRQNDVNWSLTLMHLKDLFNLPVWHSVGLIFRLGTSSSQTRSVPLPETTTMISKTTTTTKFTERAKGKWQQLWQGKMIHEKEILRYMTFSFYALLLRFLTDCLVILYWSKWWVHLFISPLSRVKYVFITKLH